ncbi:MAG: hypothetical protein KAJ19_20715 [Gammaproteobacteria bacterium]|nr:hypothetical protein [Gammaproteobacteria bacterium]
MADGGSITLAPIDIEGPVAEASGRVGRTMTTDTEFETLRIDCGGNRPCSIEDFDSGAAHRFIHNILRREFKQQVNRGLEGLKWTKRRRRRSE